MLEAEAFDQNHHADWIAKENQAWNCNPGTYINICFWKFVFTVQQEKICYYPFLKKKKKSFLEKIHHALLSRQIKYITVIVIITPTEG